MRWRARVRIVVVALVACLGASAGGAEPEGAGDEAEPAAAAWLREHALPLAGVEAGIGFDDLEPLRDIVGEARVVALGEATHGTREFFQMKHRLLEFLVSEMGFTAFGIEATLPEAFDVDRWVVTGEGDPEKALTALYFWTWNTEEVMDLLQWMRGWNADPSHERKIRFYGFDMQSPTRAAKVALEALAGADRRAAARLRQRLTGVTSAYAASNLARLPRPDREGMLEAARELDAALADRAPELAAELGTEESARVRRCARVLVQNLELRTVDPEEEAAGIRDRCMAENVQWMLDQEGPDGRIAIWAHNGHVSTIPVAMGGHLREALGEGLRAFGFAFYEGAFQAVDWPPPGRGLTTFLAPPAPEGTLDAALAATGLETAAWDLRALPPTGPAADWFASGPATRGIGAVGSPLIAARAFNRRPVAECYDVLVFIRRTSAARAMPAGARRRPAVLEGLSNAGFERGDPGSAPRDWSAPACRQAAFGYRVEMREGGAREGSRVLCVEGSGGGYGESWGGASQLLDAERFRGRRVRLAADVRTQGAMEAHLTVAPQQVTLSPGGPVGSVTARTSGWRRLVAEVDVPEEATTISIELGAEGSGSACFDDVSLELLEDREP